MQVRHKACPAVWQSSCLPRDAVFDTCFACTIKSAGFGALGSTLVSDVNRLFYPRQLLARIWHGSTYLACNDSSASFRAIASFASGFLVWSTWFSLAYSLQYVPCTIHCTHLACTIMSVGVRAVAATLVSDVVRLVYLRLILAATNARRNVSGRGR